ncbi:MAG TPA: tetratricopeptide repeat protein [Thermoanaerobaculia bacterium]|nr:tetratricopeptide repeat protein [Thermoanaerobaculia bacterium]
MIAARILLVSTLAASLALAACTQYQPFDAEGFLEQELDRRVDRDRRARAEVPFALSPEIEKVLTEKYKPGPNELRRVEQVLDFIFQRIDLTYSLTPTRNAVGTYRSRQGNCLSFVNLFVGVARFNRLTPFYVEVTDYQRWNYKDGLVVSRGHIVAGMYVNGKLRTYDFLPYRAKAYRQFKPIDDLTAAAHYYNNLGAEALMEGDIEQALDQLQIAREIAPDFIKGLNNLGVVYARTGKVEEAVEIYQRALAVEPEDPALLTNLARAYQQLGRLDEAQSTLTKVEGINSTNPFFFVYQSEVALARNDNQAALDYLAEALRQDSELPEVHVALVKTYLAMGDVGRARHHLERALRLDATNREALRLAVMLGSDGATAGKP